MSSGIATPPQALVHAQVIGIVVLANSKVVNVASSSSAEAAVDELL